MLSNSLFTSDLGCNAILSDSDSETLHSEQRVYLLYITYIMCNCSHISIYAGVTISLQFIGTGLFIDSICTSNAKHNSGHLERRPVYTLIICMNRHLLYCSATFKYFNLHTYIVDMVLGGTTKYMILKLLE